METGVNILLWIHLAALGLGGVSIFGIPVVGSKIAAATTEVRPLLFAIMQGLTRIGRAGLVVLLITGPLMFWLKWSFTAPSMTWFGIKMVLVLLLLGLVIYAGINGHHAEKGDMSAARRAPAIGITGIVVFLAVILAAVFAFD